MARGKPLHIVVRWGAAVLLAEEIEPDTRALRVALAARMPELASRLTVASGRIVLDAERELDETREVVVGDFVVEASAAADERAARTTQRPSGLVLGAALSSVIVHGLFVASLALFHAPLETTETDAPLSIRADLDALKAAAAASAASAAPPPPNAEGTSARSGGSPGSMSAHREGAMGSRTAPMQRSQYGMSGAAKKRSAEGAVPGIDDARTFGMIGLLTTRATLGDDRPGGWGAVLGGADARAAHGMMWGGAIDDAFGEGGLGLSGTGEGGGGRGHGVGLVPDDLDVFGSGGEGGGGAGEGLGLGSIGTIRHGAGGGEGFCGGCEGRLPGSHRSKAPTLRCPTENPCTATVSGRLPPEIIQRVVRQNFGRFRLCYESARTAQPGLDGRVAVRFVIDRDGSVASASVSDSTLPSSASGCVARAFTALSFPAPEGGLVTVTYPIDFSPK